MEFYEDLIDLSHIQNSMVQSLITIKGEHQERPYKVHLTYIEYGIFKDIPSPPCRPEHRAASSLRGSGCEARSAEAAVLSTILGFCMFFPWFHRVYPRFMGY